MLYRPRILKRIAKDLVTCAQMMRKPWQCYGYLRSGRQPEIGQFRFKGMSFLARKEDWVAIREVLVEDEYQCVDDLFDGDSEPRVLDLGANIGSFALRVFARCPSASVVSVEPADDTFAILRQNHQTNKHLSWELVHAGVWSDDRPLSLMRRGISVGHRVVAQDAGDTVSGIALQTLIDKLGWEAIDLIKMDIEGGEESVIPSAESVLKKTQTLIVEVHSDRIDPAPVISVLARAFSYRWQLNDRQSSKPLYILANRQLNLRGLAQPIEL